MLYELQIAKDEKPNMKHRFSLLMNETYRVDERVKQVEQLKNIQSLQDLQTVHHQIQSITAQTLSLSQNHFARNQDFLALYNQTSVGFVQAVSRLKHLESFQNVSLTNTKVIEDRLKHLEAFRNISIMNMSRLTMKTKELQTQITNDKRPGMNIDFSLMFNINQLIEYSNRIHLICVNKYIKYASTHITSISVTEIYCRNVKFIYSNALQLF